MSFQAFGDSITVGTGASSGQSWVGLFTPDNDGVSGAVASSMSTLVQGVTPDASKTYTIMIGTNDVRIYKDDTAKQDCFKDFLRNSVAWLCMDGAADCAEVGGSPNPNMTYTGTWSSISVNTCGRETTQLNASAEITVSGTAVYIGYIIQDVSAADTVAEVYIDNVLVGTLTPKQPLGSGYAPACARFGGLSSGNHDVKIVNTVSGKKFYLNYIKGSDQVNSPKILLSNVIKYSAAGYTNYGVTESTTDAYNTIISDLISEFTADGMDVTLVDNHASIDNTTDLSDYVHPNNAGHLKIHNNFKAAL